MVSTGDGPTEIMRSKDDDPWTAALPSILILTPVKNATSYLENYVAGLESLTYPRSRLSLGILESDSIDNTNTMLTTIASRLERRFSRVKILSRDYNFRLPAGVERWAPSYQK